MKPRGLMFVNSSDNDLSNRVLDGSGVTEFNFFRISGACIKPLPCQRPVTLELYHAISTLRKNYGLISNDPEILRQSEIATASTSNEIVEAESI